MTNTDPMCLQNADAAAQLDSRAAATIEICRGVQRLLFAHGLASVTELMLPDGKRADVAALGKSGELWIIEVKSCLADLKADSKWQDYADYCDRLWMAVDRRFPIEVIPDTAGLIIADRYGADIMRQADKHAMPAPRRRSMTLQFARTAAARLQTLRDPQSEWSL